MSGSKTWVAGIAAALTLVAAACTEDEFKTGYEDGAGGGNEVGVTPPDKGNLTGLPDGYIPYPCTNPGKSCNAHDPCAINPVCSMDKKCIPQTVMNCDDGLDCTLDTCAGAGMCDNRPQKGYCRLAVKVGANQSCKDLELDGGWSKGSTPDGGAGKTIICCFREGDRNPNDGCLACVLPIGGDGGKSGDATKWTPANGGYCDDGNACTKNDYCQNGQCKGTSYMSQCSDGYSCTTDLCDGKGGCLGNKLKADYCLINGTCYKENTAHPTGQCLTCAPKKSQSVWSSVSNTCTIGGKCYNKGAQHTGKCAECDPAISTTKWVVTGSACLIKNVCKKPGDKDPTGCSSCDPTKDKYDFSALPGMCKISGKCYKAGDKHPKGCAECDPSVSTTAWTVKVTTHCLISNACVASGTKDPKPGSCSSCQPAVNKYDYSADAGYCKIDNKCILNATKHPQGCATCDTKSSTSAWTPNTAKDCLIDHQCQTVCGSTCADLKSNPSHCGTCGNGCAVGLFCVAGKCGQAAPSCYTIKANSPAAKSGVYSLFTTGSTKPFSAYCDMVSDGGGWTLVARFSNKDAKNWIDSAGWWYSKVAEAGKPTSNTDNYDAISQAFWKVKGQELKITRTDDVKDKHLLKTKTKCLGGKTFRGKIKSLGTYKTGAWSSNAVRGTCDADLGNNYSGTTGFKYATCKGDIGKPKSIGFFADWSSGDGAVMMFGGGGNSCARADHGIAITEGNDAQFGTTCSGCTTRYDFGDGVQGSTSYSLNLFVR